MMWIWACVGLAVGKPMAGQLYSSQSLMDDLFVFDKLVGDVLPLLPEHIPAASRYQESYWSMAQDRAMVGGHVTAVEVTGNPLHVYWVIKRLVLYWPALNISLQHYHTQDGVCEDKSTNCPNWVMRGECLHNRNYMVFNCPLSCGVCPSPELRERLVALMEAYNSTVLPIYNDLLGAAYALARLQRYYRIPIGNFMQGRLDNTYSSVRLTPEDCITIANATHYFGEMSDAWLWYKYCRTTTDDPHQHDYIQTLMDDLERQHDSEWTKGDSRYFQRPLSESHFQVSSDSPTHRVCRGVHKIPVDGQLQCHVSAHGAPYLALQPVRYELLHQYPHIYLFYDVLQDFEIQTIKKLAKSRLSRSTVVGSNRYMEIRVSQTGWLNNASHPSLLSIARRISYITGLHVFEGPPEHMAGEYLQVLNYGIGGHYVMHSDLFYKKFPEGRWNESLAGPHEYTPGDRLATWMFYLSDVKLGGRTGFQFGFSVAPVKGAAVFWYNLKRNGDADFKTQHGGCPVVLGHKWVANKWIREHTNFLRRTCSTNPEE
ncbi:prolyl 4-hydroxylase subunit alpha-3-like isoform X2 [Homarus americanus]|nr:prolyl 4-hydroxylase subunit alpha-3-like isoform X2 [Homarus americanus]